MKKIFTVFLICILLLTGCAKKPVSWDEQFHKGIDNLATGYYEEAIMALTAAIEAEPDEIDAYIARAQAYLLNGETAENLTLALADYTTALTLSGPGSTLYVLDENVTVLEKIGYIQEKLSALNSGEETATKEEITVNIDGNNIVLNSGYELLENEILIPADSIAIAEGIKVASDAQSGAVVITSGGRNLSMNVDSTTAVIGESKVPVSVPAKMIDGVVSVPLRFVLEIFDSGEMSVDENGMYEFSSVPYITEADHYKKKVKNAYDWDPDWDFGYHEVSVPKFNVDTDNGRAFDAKISEYSKKVIKLLKNNEEETYIFGNVSYSYSILDGILTVIVSSTEGMQYSEGWNITKCYYYDLINDREITDYNEYLEIMNIDYDKAVAEVNKRVEDTDDYGNKIVLTTDPDGECPINYIIFGNDFTRVEYYNPYGMGINVTFTFEGILQNVQK